MTERHRRVEYVVERKIVRAVAVGVITSALANVLAAGCALAWLRASGVAGGPVWLIGAVALAHFAGGCAALIGYGWAR